VGSGLWVLFGARVLHSAPTFVASTIEFTRTGAMTPTVPLVLLGLIVLGTAVLVAIASAKDETGALLVIDPWPPTIGFASYFAAMWAVLQFVPGPPRSNMVLLFPFVTPGSWTYIIGLSVVVAAVGWLRVVRFNATAVERHSPSRSIPNIAAVTGICLAAAVAPQFNDGHSLGPKNLVALVVEALTVLRVLMTPRTTYGSASFGIPVASCTNLDTPHH
jgi:hypothetical protein